MYLFTGSEELERDVEFEVIGDAPDKAPPPPANQEEVNNIANGNKESSQQSTSAEGWPGPFDSFLTWEGFSLSTFIIFFRPSVAAQPDDIMIVDSDVEEQASSSSAAVATGATKRKHADVDSDSSVKRPRTDQSMTPSDDDEDEVLELD